MSDNKELVRVARAWKVSPFDDYAGKVALVGQLCDALEVADEAARALIAEVRELEAEVERLRQVLATLATETNISQEERKYHARSALEAKP